MRGEGGVAEGVGAKQVGHLQACGEGGRRGSVGTLNVQAQRGRMRAGGRGVAGGAGDGQPVQAGRCKAERTVVRPASIAMACCSPITAAVHRPSHASLSKNLHKRDRQPSESLRRSRRHAWNARRRPLAGPNAAAAGPHCCMNTGEPSSGGRGPAQACRHVPRTSLHVHRLALWLCSPRGIALAGLVAPGPLGGAEVAPVVVAAGGAEREGGEGEEGRGEVRGRKCRVHVSVGWWREGRMCGAGAGAVVAGAQARAWAGQRVGWRACVVGKGGGAPRERGADDGPAGPGVGRPTLERWPLRVLALGAGARKRARGARGRPAT